MKERRVQKSHGVALLTPYDGGNLGDSAIQEALIENLRCYAPDAELYGITLDPARTSTRHGIRCYPLNANSTPHYQAAAERPGKAHVESSSPTGEHALRLYRQVKRLVRIVPFVVWLKILVHEIRHVIQSYRLLRKVDVLVIAGGGQLDDEWGGSWGHPYALMKWSVMARVSGSSVVFLSVGACRIGSRLTKLFLGTALSLACYRSYRDAGSLQLALSITRHAEGRVVPDLAFSLPNVVSKTGFRPDVMPLRVGISPIAYCHPELWPTKDHAQYQRYITELAFFVNHILQCGFSVCLFSSSPPDDQVFADIYNRLDPILDPGTRTRLTSSSVTTLRDLFDVLNSVDTVVASRLHGILLSLLSGKPSIAISYDRKVTCLMEELSQSEYCVDIRSFKRDDLLERFSMLRVHTKAVQSTLAATCRQYDEVLQEQYRDILQLRLGRCRSQFPKNPRAFSEEKP